MTSSIVEQARIISTCYHQGQWRRSSYRQGQLGRTAKLPYIVHPQNVAKILYHHGYDDETTQAIAWLHDTLEDTAITYEQLSELFGKKIAQGVYLLTRNVDREEYKQRLLTANTILQIIKIADTVDNLLTLDALTPQGIKRKIVDTQHFYLPLAQKIAPALAQEMERVLRSYQQDHPSWRSPPPSESLH